MWTPWPAASGWSLAGSSVPPRCAIVCRGVETCGVVRAGAAGSLLCKRPAARRRRHSYLNEKLRADEATSRRSAPMMQDGGPLKPLSLVVGSAELPLLRKQTADFAGHRARYGLPVTYEEIPDANHFSIMYEMMSPKGRITTLIRQLFDRTTGQS